MIELPSQPMLPMELPKLVSIEGGRAIAARDVQAAFAVDADSVSTETLNMAGYIIIAWDDEGGIEIKVSNAPRSPIASILLPNMARELVEGHIMRGDA